MTKWVKRHPYLALAFGYVLTFVKTLLTGSGKARTCCDVMKAETLSGSVCRLTSEKPRKPLKRRAVRGLSRASYQNRTDDLFITSETLYRLS
jgi:hypothetical protein